MRWFKWGDQAILTPPKGLPVRMLEEIASSIPLLATKFVPSCCSCGSCFSCNHSSCANQMPPWFWIHDLWYGSDFLKPCRLCDAMVISEFNVVAANEKERQNRAKTRKGLWRVCRRRRGDLCWLLLLLLFSVGIKVPVADSTMGRPDTFGHCLFSVGSFHPDFGGFCPPDLWVE